MAIGLNTPDSGKILFKNIDLASLEEKDFYRIRPEIGYVFQSGALFDSMTVEDNLAYPLRLHTSWGEEKILKKVNERLSVVGLEGTNLLFPDEISGGMQKRVGLLRAQMLDPQITLYDEPTAGLDPMNVRRFSQAILRLKNVCSTAGLFVTHDIDCAFAVCDHIAILNEGRIYAMETVEKIRQSKDPLILSFIDTDYTKPDPLEIAERGHHAQPKAS
jgi:phospholipid/cholesterol/gamma-HCH transport system ATP-binding protein